MPNFVKKELNMKYIIIILICLTSCSNHKTTIDYEQILSAAESRANQAKSLSEDTLLCEALKYYQTSEPKDSARLLQATILTAYHYWWKGEKTKANNLLEPIADTNKYALKALLDISSKNYDYEAVYKYLNRILEDEKEHNFENLQALATINYYLNRPDECKQLFENVTQYIKTPKDSIIYWKRVLPNYADIISDYGDQKRAIELRKQVLNHFMGKDSTIVAVSYASLARYYLLQNNIKKAEEYLLLSRNYATDKFKNNLSMASYMKLLESVLLYAKDRRINMIEWANFVNSMDENSYIEQAITNAKEENNRLLTEQNLKLTIEKQHTQIILTYIGIVLTLVIALWIFYHHKKKHQLIEKEEELESLRKLISESQESTEQKDDRFFKRILLQQLGVIKMASANPTSANIELLKRMKAITNQEINVDSILNWNDLYQTIDYIYNGYYSSLINRFGTTLSDKEIQLCCLLKANFSTKEISVVTQQSVRTVYQRKSTIRQALQMPEAEDIATFLSNKQA